MRGMAAAVGSHEQGWVPCRRLFASTGSGSYRRNVRYQRLAGVEKPVDFPTTQVNDTWAVFENDIEAIIKDAVGKDFDAIEQQAVDELKYDGTSMLMKNTEGAARLIELIYEGRHNISVLEEVVNKITALHRSAVSAAAGDLRV